MKLNIALVIITALTTFGLIMLVSSLTPTGEVDELTKRACREYADSHPERSIITERRKWLEEQGLDYMNYDYYQDCINQKLPVELGRGKGLMYGNGKN